MNLISIFSFSLEFIPCYNLLRVYCSDLISIGAVRALDSCPFHPHPAPFPSHFQHTPISYWARSASDARILIPTFVGVRKDVLESVKKKTG